MTLKETIELLEAVATGQPAVHAIARGDVFKLNARPDIDYGVFGWVQGIHGDTVQSDIRRFAFSLFYIDRLTPDKGNELEAQSTGVEVLGSILRTLADELLLTSWELHPFTQRFKDECAGVWADVTLQVPVSLPCGEVWKEKGYTRGSFNESYDASFDVWRLTVGARTVQLLK